MDVNKFATELQDAGLTQPDIINVVRIKNNIYEIVWADGHPTGTEQADADAVLSAHDPIDYVELRRNNAKALFQSSALSDMTIGEAEAWIVANIADVPTQTAMIHQTRMILGLRDWVLAEIRGQQPD